MKLTHQQIAQVIVETSEEIKETSKKIAFAQKDYLEKIDRVDLSVDDKKARETIVNFNKAVEKASNELQKAKKDYSLLYVSSLFLISSVFLFFMVFKFYTKTNLEIRKSYRQELIEEKRLLTPNDAEFVQKLIDWKAKNPKSYEKFLKIMEE